MQFAFLEGGFCFFVEMGFRTCGFVKKKKKKKKKKRKKKKTAKQKQKKKKTIKPKHQSTHRKKTKKNHTTHTIHTDVCLVGGGGVRGQGGGGIHSSVFLKWLERLKLPKGITGVAETSGFHSRIVGGQCMAYGEAPINKKKEIRGRKYIYNIALRCRDMERGEQRDWKNLLGEQRGEKCPVRTPNWNGSSRRA